MRNILWIWANTRPLAEKENLLLISAESETFVPYKDRQ